MPRVIVYMTFGSHLYGTNTPQSDMDYRGVMLPDAEAVLCCRAPRTKNSSTKSGNEVRNGPDDIDTEVYSLHYFLDLAYAGETVALDMLHARKEQTTCWSPIWDELHRNRHRFYTKNLKSLVAYARKQAAKYGVKGSRVSAFREALACLKAHPDNKRLEDVWEYLPENEHLSKGHNGHDAIWNVCGKQLVGRAYVGHYISLLEDTVARYGQRAIEAESNKGIDWKAVMHAFRAAYQVRSILMHGDFAYPLAEVETLREIRSGALDWKTRVGPMLDSLLLQVDALSQSSPLPERADRAWGELFLLEVMRGHVSASDLCVG